MSAVRGVPPPALPRSLPLSFSFCNSFALVLRSFRSRLPLAFVLVLLPTLFQFASDPCVDIFHLPSGMVRRVPEITFHLILAVNFVEHLPTLLAAPSLPLLN